MKKILIYFILYYTIETISSVNGLFGLKKLLNKTVFIFYKKFNVILIF